MRDKKKIHTFLAKYKTKKEANVRQKAKQKSKILGVCVRLEV